MPLKHHRNVRRRHLLSLPRTPLDRHNQQNQNTEMQRQRGRQQRPQRARPTHRHGHRRPPRRPRRQPNQPRHPLRANHTPRQTQQPPPNTSDSSRRHPEGCRLRQARSGAPPRTPPGSVAPLKPPPLGSIARGQSPLAGFGGGAPFLLAANDDPLRLTWVGGPRISRRLRRGREGYVPLWRRG